ncbi:MAG: M48 family metalloprotease [Gammaproteobacteria bacterium]
MKRVYNQSPLGTTGTLVRSDRSSKVLDALVFIVIKALAIACLLLSGAFSAAAFDLPEIGDPSGAVLSPAQERRLGAAFFREIRRQATLIDDPEIQQYLQTLGASLVAQSDDRGKAFNFFIVQHPTINAFAAPGGYIGVHTGLILNSQNESELAGVLAHEVAHVTQRHMARTFERAGQLSIPVAAAMLGALLLGTQSPQAGQAALAAVVAGSTQYQIDFTRANEQEADRVGIQFLARAGFDPAGMPSFFQRLQLANRLTDPKHIPEFLRTHPVTVSRIADSRNRVAQYPPITHTDSLSYHLMRANLAVATAQEPAEALRYYEESLRSGEFYREDVARYGYALALTAIGEYGKARVQIEALARSPEQDLAYALAAARLAIADGRAAEGLSLYDKALSLYPDSKPVILAYVEALLNANKTPKARELLQLYSQRHDPTVTYYALLARAEGQAGSNVESHLAQAEFYYLNGETELAKNQLDIASREASATRYQLERIAARLEILLKELEEEKQRRS